MIELKNYIMTSKIRDWSFNIVWFSRQKPEMEESFSFDLLPPFIEEDTGFAWFVHGTIWNDKELQEKYNLPELKVDTEIFKYLNKINEDDYRSLNKIKGLYSAVMLDDYDYSLYNGGLGFWKGEINGIETIAVSPVNNSFKLIDLNKTAISATKHDLYIAYSGGMDITLSTIKEINDIIELRKELFGDEALIINVNLIYFDYGTAASDQEKKSLNNFKDFLEKHFGEKANLNVSTRIIDFNDIINGSMKLINSDYLRLKDKNAEVDNTEAENNSSYVPYRNTLFMSALGAIIDQDIDDKKLQGLNGLDNLFNENIEIIIGLNLSEGQVYLDNGIAWKENMEKVVNYGGKHFKDVKIISSYIHKTKINMLKLFKNKFGEELLKEALNIAFSCYFPKDGKPCGECGSCKLRIKAEKEVLNENKS